MLERLQEEVERVRRLGGPLCVVLGELLPVGEEDPAMADALATWAAEQVGRGKRRCDVAGQYGSHGFMLLLPRTGEAAALGLCRRLRQVLEEGPSGCGPLRACFGVAALEAEEGTSLTRLLRRAEDRLEAAKNGAALESS
jgi:diguanylate cyclase (GGDEF)-like protein